MSTWRHRHPTLFDWWANVIAMSVMVTIFAIGVGLTLLVILGAVWVALHVDLLLGAAAGIAGFAVVLGTVDWVQSRTDR